MEHSPMDSLLLGAALRYGATRAAIAAVADIPFRAEFREMCAMNTCGKFGRCWMCPPDVGPIDRMIEQAKTYKKALVFQTVSPLEDSFDIEGMERAAHRHNKILRVLRAESGAAYSETLFMGAGACHGCRHCARAGGLPCRRPPEAVASLEAYGIAVSELALLCGMPYHGGANTVTYFAAVLHGKTREENHADC